MLCGTEARRCDELSVVKSREGRVLNGGVKEDTSEPDWTSESIIVGVCSLGMDA